MVSPYYEPPRRQSTHRRPKPDWVPLQLEDGAYRGDLFLEMTFYAAAPPPLQRRPSKWSPKDRLKRPTSTYSYGPMPTVPEGNGVNAAAQKDSLPPLPEESEPAAAPPPTIPAFLRPGGGATSPKRGSSRLPAEPLSPGQTSPRDVSPSSATRILANASKAPVESIPAYLRPGGGAARPPPSHGRTSSQVSIPEPKIPSPEVPSYGPPPAASSYPPSLFLPPSPTDMNHVP